ncbi:MAG TPA: hypothetical protein VFJ91_02455 [Gaiellaceae bacterium]|nr:hypothetical protein [Gaiellaceae bacterium]
MSDSGLLHRYDGNPILSAADWPSTVNAVFNPGAARLDGETVLLVRVEDRTGLSHLCVARSRDGLTGWRVASEPALEPMLGWDAERFGIEDPRITQCGEDFMVVYTGYSSAGPLVCLASTRDFEHFERLGTIMPPEDKDAALFPQRLGGRWALVHRPVSTAPRHAAHLWLSWSPDLHHWGDHTILLPAREGGWWDAHKVGLCPPPLLTDRGWLLLYHGVRTTASGSIYRLGLALLDREHPEQVLARSSEWIFGPEAEYERSGDVAGVVFPCGWTLADDGDTLLVYYGAADTTVCVATASLSALLAWLERHPSWGAADRRLRPRPG